MSVVGSDPLLEALLAIYMTAVVKCHWLMFVAVVLVARAAFVVLIFIRSWID
jgi:hypothetical protein